MRPTASLLTLLRSPVKTCVTFILLGVVSFAFFTQVISFTIIKRELNKAAQLYCGVGAAGTTNHFNVTDISTPFYIEQDPRITENNNNTYFQTLSATQVDAIINLPHIAISDMRYMTVGVSSKYYRLFEGGICYPYTARVILEATLTDVKLGPSLTHRRRT